MLPASYAAMTTPAPVAPYGLGVRLETVLGHPAVSHGGAINGFLCFLVYFPHKDIAIAVLMNARPAPADYSQVIGLAVAKAALASGTIK
jgi:hypothetical protein